MTTTPSAVMRRSLRAHRRALIASGNDDARMSKRRWTEVATLLTFWPPAPWARTALHSISAGLIGVRSTVGPACTSPRLHQQTSDRLLNLGPVSLGKSP